MGRHDRGFEILDVHQRTIAQVTLGIVPGRRAHASLRSLQQAHCEKLQSFLGIVNAGAFVEGAVQAPQVVRTGMRHRRLEPVDRADEWGKTEERPVGKGWVRPVKYRWSR